MKESKDRSLEDYRDYLEELQQASKKIITFAKPIIAAINGYALGSRYKLALACDIRIAAEEAQIGSPEVRVASSITGDALRLVQDLIGPGKAKELLFTAGYIDGKEAGKIGLVNRAVPLDQLMETTKQTARKIVQNSPFSIKMIKTGLSLARELNKRESEVKAGLKHDGYLLMTPETFVEVLEKMQCGILDGSMSLPIAVDGVIEQIN